VVSIPPQWNDGNGSGAMTASPEEILSTLRTTRAAYAAAQEYYPRRIETLILERKRIDGLIDDARRVLDQSSEKIASYDAKISRIERDIARAKEGSGHPDARTRLVGRIAAYELKLAKMRRELGDTTSPDTLTEIEKENRE